MSLKKKVVKFVFILKSYRIFVWWSVIYVLLVIKFVCCSNLVISIKYMFSFVNMFC